MNELPDELIEYFKRTILGERVPIIDNNLNIKSCYFYTDELKTFEQMKKLKMKWISVKDRLPDEGKQVLTFNAKQKDYDDYRLDYIVLMNTEPNGYIWACRLDDHYNYETTHWIPLPEPPNE